AGDGGGVDADLVGPGAQEPVDVVGGADAAPDGQGDEDLLGGAGHDVVHGLAPAGGGGDVEERELVGPGRVIGGGQLDRVPGIAEVLEIDALDHPPGIDVQAGNHTHRNTHATSLPG